MSSVMDALVKAVRSAAIFNAEVQVAPACILWPDRERQWEAVIPRLQTEMPELFVLGDYAPEVHRGPAIWLRCVLAGKCHEDLGAPFAKVVEEAKKPYSPGSSTPYPLVPILYLPGVGRQDLRAVESCPEELKPLAELQYRGAIWSQINAKDWTILAFLKTDQGGLGLDVAQNVDTRHAMLLALYRLLDEDVSLLQGKRLDKDFFNKLLSGGDPTRDILLWIDQGEAFRTGRGESEWQAFVEVTRSQLGFDPAVDGQLLAAEKLATHEGGWLPVWERFCEAPHRYPNIPELIRRCGSPKDLFADRSGWPQLNEADEKDLEKALLRIASKTGKEARKQIRKLDQEHGERRSWVWAELGESPLAMAIAPLREMAQICDQSMAVGTIDDLVAIYTTGGWEADQAVMQALAEVTEASHVATVTAVIQSIYKPWIEDGARHFQDLARTAEYPGRKRKDLKTVSPTAGEVYLFVDGMRYDIAQRLLRLMEQDSGLALETRRVWSALPSVTATAKPAVSPVADRIIGGEVSSDFEPSVQETGQSLKGGYHLEKLLKDDGWQVLKRGESGDTAGSAWTEVGDIDKKGHEQGWKLAKEIDRLVEEIRGQVAALLAEGWTTVRIVTDHGFLLLPGGLPGSHLPSSLAENAWGRCAALKPGANSSEAHYSWFWNASHCFALADGVSCYGRKREYAHGGISVQECLTLDITVRLSAGRARSSAIEVTDKTWRGMRLTVALEGNSAGMSLDLRRHPGDPSSTVAMNVKAFQENGKASVVVEDDSLVSEKVYGVVLDENGQLAAQFETTIGGES